VTAPEFFKNLGYSMNDVILVSSKEAGMHQEGVNLNA
jgi:hypothetical protein